MEMFQKRPFLMRWVQACHLIAPRDYGEGNRTHPNADCMG